MDQLGAPIMFYQIEFKDASAFREKLVTRACVMFGEYQYSIGDVGPVYCDARKVYSHQDMRNLVVSTMRGYLSSSGVEVKGIVGIERGGISWGSVIAYLAQLPYVGVRGEVKHHGDKSQFSGDTSLISGGSVVVIEDTVRTGNGLFAGVSALSEIDCHPADIVTLFNYNLPVAQLKAEAQGLEVRSIAMVADLTVTAHEFGCINEATRKDVLTWLNK